MSGVDIELGVADWLAKANVLGGERGHRSHTNPDTHVEYSKEVANALNNGTAVARLLQHLDPNNSKLPSVSHMKSSNTPTDRLHNWNLISKALLHFKVRLDPDIKGLIVNGDLDVVLELLGELRQKNGGSISNGAVSARSTRAVSGQGDQVSLDIKFLDSCRDPEQAANALEFLVIVMCVKLGLHAKQAAALLTANTKYLTHMLEKGVSGKFDFAPPFYSHILQHAGLLAKLLHQNTNTIPFALNILCAAFNSTHEESCQWVCRIFVRLSTELTSLGDGRILSTWLVQPKDNLDAILGCFRRHPDARDAAVLVLIELAQSQLGDALTSASLALNGVELAGLVTKIVVAMQARGTKKQSDLLAVAPKLVGLAAKKAIDTHDNSERSDILQELIGLWQHQTAYVAVVESSAATKSVLDLIKKASRDDDGTEALRGMLALFDAVVASAKGGAASAQSVAIWKALVFGLFERKPGDESLHALSQGLAVQLNKHPDLPSAMIVEPLAKQIAVHGTSQLDFDFLSAVVKHQKLSGREAKTLLETLAKIFADGDDNTAKDVMPLLIGLTKRFANDSAIIRHCQRVVEEASLVLQPQFSASSKRQGMVVALFEALAKLSKQHAEIVRHGIESLGQETVQRVKGLETMLQKLGGSISSAADAPMPNAYAPTPADPKPEPPAGNDPAKRGFARNGERYKNVNEKKSNKPVEAAPEEPKLGPRARARKEAEEKKKREEAEAAAKRAADPAVQKEEQDSRERKRQQAKLLLEQRKRREEEIQEIIAKKAKKIADQKEEETNKRAKSAEAKQRLNRMRIRERKKFLAEKKAKEEAKEGEKAAEPNRGVVASAPDKMSNPRKGSPSRNKPFWVDGRVACMNQIVQKYPHERRKDVKEVADVVYDIIHVAIHGPKPPHIEPPKNWKERENRISKFNNPDPSRALLTKLQANRAQMSPEHADIVSEERKRLARAEKLHAKIAEYQKEKEREEARLKEAERVYDELRKAKEKEKQAREKARREAEKARVLEWRQKRQADVADAKKKEANRVKMEEKEKQRLNIEYMKNKAERQNKVKVNVEKIEHKEDDEEAKKKAADKKKRAAAKKRQEDKKKVDAEEGAKKEGYANKANKQPEDWFQGDDPAAGASDPTTEKVIAPDGTEEDWDVLASEPAAADNAAA